MSDRPLEERLIGAAAGFLALALIAFAYRRLRGREGLGGGDPKLLAAIGAWLGWQQLPFVMLGAGLLGLAAVLLRAARGETIAATDRLPLGTLMALAAWPIWLISGSLTLRRGLLMGLKTGSLRAAQLSGRAASSSFVRACGIHGGDAARGD